MIDSNIVQPDVTLTLSREGLVEEATVSVSLADEALADWRGRPWGETIDAATGANIGKLIEDVRRSGASSIFKVKQRFPSGRQLQMEYTAVSRGKADGIIAIGRSVQAVADLESRLLAAQQEREQGYWKLRDIETRYRLLFDAASDAVILVRAANLRVVEVNVVASKALGLAQGAEFSAAIPARDRASFEAMLGKVRESGRAPGILLHMPADGSSWSLRASMMAIDSGAFYLFQMAPLGAGGVAAPIADAYSVEDLIQRLPDGFVVVDKAGVVRSANPTFLDLAQVGSESAVVGKNLKRWLGRPGADAGVILGLVRKHGSVRLFSTQLAGELGSDVEIEVSAVGSGDLRAEYVGLMLRDVSKRLGAVRSAPAEDSPGPQTLEALIAASTEAIERKSITKALENSAGNRTAAAKALGLSRQSLHIKLNKYCLGDAN